MTSAADIEAWIEERPVGERTVADYLVLLDAYEAEGKSDRAEVIRSQIAANQTDQMVSLMKSAGDAHTYWERVHRERSRPGFEDVRTIDALPGWGPKRSPGGFLLYLRLWSELSIRDLYSPENSSTLRRLYRDYVDTLTFSELESEWDSTPSQWKREILRQSAEGRSAV